MTRTTSAALAAALALAVGCSGGGAAAEAHTLTVAVAAAESGLGCTQSIELSGLDMGRGSRLTVTDQDGSVVGTGTFDLTDDVICHWEAEVEVGPAEFYTLEAGGELATVSRDDLVGSNWATAMRISVTGNVTTVMPA